jgi:hypothetical protein
MKPMPFDWKAWFGSAKIRSLSPYARSLYIEIVGLMWMSDDFGYLSITRLPEPMPMPIETIARMLGMKTADVESGLREIDKYALLPKTKNGTYYSKKFVEMEAKKEEKRSRPFMSYEEYIADEMESYCSLIHDTEWISLQQKYHPSINVLLTMEKAHSEFWSTIAGYDCKKKAKVTKINWKKTYANAIGMKMNIVWLSREEVKSSENNSLLSRLKEIKI